MDRSTNEIRKNSPWTTMFVDDILYSRKSKEMIKLSGMIIFDSLRLVL